jgi:hypothetical protein
MWGRIMGFHVAHSWHVYQQAASAGRKNIFFVASEKVTELCACTLALPLVLGMFWGAPLIAKEYEAGTQTLLWTQSITRRKWLSVKLRWLLTAAALYGAIMSAAVTWCLRTENAVAFDRFQPNTFDTQGLVPVAYAIFAVALGVALGAWLRRSLLALALTLCIFVPVRFDVMHYLRPHYMPSIVQTNNFSLAGQGAGVIEVPRSLGAELNVSQHYYLTGDCLRQPTLNFAPAGVNGRSCAEHMTTRYQPANRYWLFQGIESGIYMGFALILVGTTYWLVLKRDA